VLDLRDIFELIDNRFNDGALAGQKLIHQRHELILHIALGLYEQLNAQQKSSTEQKSSSRLSMGLACIAIG
jgi:hypothetical protein